MNRIPGMNRDVEGMKAKIAEMRQEIASLEQDLPKVQKYASQIIQININFLKDRIAQFRNYAERWASNEEMDYMFGK